MANVAVIDSEDDNSVLIPPRRENPTTVGTSLGTGLLEIRMPPDDNPETMPLTLTLTPGDPGGGGALTLAPALQATAGDNILDDSQCEFKSPKKCKVPSPRGVVSIASTLPVDDDSAECPICFEDWSNTGEHRLASLKCGHLFGMRCIEKWLREQKPGKCPQCKAKAVKKDIRPLFAKTLKMVDTSDRDAALRALQQERAARQAAEMESAQSRLRVQLAQEEVRRLQQELERTRQREANARLSISVGTPLSEGTECSRGIVNSQCASQPASVKLNLIHSGYVFEQIVKVWEAGSCRVLAYDARSAMLVASQPSASPLFPGFGIKKISALDFRTMQYVAIHKKVIRDICFNLVANDALLLSASLDKTVKVTSMPSSMVVQVYSCPAPVWSCTWNPENTNLLYAGLANGAVSVFDTRNTSGAITQINAQGPRSPVVSLQYLASDAHSTFRPGGLLVGQLNRSSFYEHKHDEYTPHDLSIEGGLTYLSADSKSRHVLASYRQSQRAPGVRHMVYQLGAEVVGAQTTCRTNLVHTFHGGSTQKLLSRSKLLHHPTEYDKLLVCAPDEASLSLQIWDTATGNLCQKLPTQTEILDLTQVAVNGCQYLAALTDKAVRLYKWST